MIVFNDVSKSFVVKSKRKPILKNLSIKFLKGQNVAVLGAPKSGKSTFLSLLSGSIPPDSGEIITNNTISYPVAFSNALHAELSGIENTKFVARIYGQNIQRLIAFVIEFGELDSKLFRQPVKTYTPNQKSQLAFSISIGLQFDFYIVDEIISGGDSEFKEKCKHALSERLKYSSLFISSKYDIILREHCNCGIVLNNGAVTYFDDLENAIKYHKEISV